MRGGNVSRTAPLFPPKFWSVFERMELGIPKTKTKKLKKSKFKWNGES